MHTKSGVKKKLSTKILAVGTFVVLLVFISGLAFYSFSAALQYVNPVAVIAAIVVAVIGMIWFKKSVT